MSTNPDVLEFKNKRKPGIGLLITAMGLAVIVAPRFVSDFGEIPGWVRLLSALICLVPGLWMLAGLSVQRIDRGKGTVTTAWGLFVPFKSSERSLSDFKTVVIAKERDTETRRRETSTSTHQTETRTFYVFPVKLVCEDDPPERDLVDIVEESDGVIKDLANLRAFGAKMHELETERKANGRASVTLGKPRSHTAALEMAEKVADFAGLRLCDLVRS